MIVPQAESYKASIVDDSIVGILFIIIDQINNLTVENDSKNKEINNIKKLIFFLANVLHIEAIFINKYPNYRSYKKFKKNK